MSDIVRRIDDIISDLKGFEKYAENARLREATVFDRVMEGNSRIRAWLVAANAGALLICFNTMLGGQICNWIAFRPLVLLFVLGLALAFFSVMAERRAHTVFRKVMLDSERALVIATALGEAFAKVRPKVVAGDEGGAAEAMKPVAPVILELKSEMSSIVKVDNSFWHSVSGYLEFASVAALACGLVWAVSDARFIQALCT